MDRTARPTMQMKAHLVKRLLPIAIVATVTLLSACGDDTDSDDAAPPTPTTATADPAARPEAEFIDQVNGLCVEQNQAIGAIIGDLFESDEPTPEAMQEALDTIVVLSRGLADNIGGLAVPPELSDAVTAMLDALNAGNDVADAQTGPEFFGSDDDPWAEATALAADYGFTACSRESG